MTTTLNVTELGNGAELVRTLADYLISISHPSRLKIVEYCSGNPRRFTDIILDLRLNPASFKFHVKVLMDDGLVTKVERGIYRTTELGRLLLQLVNQASSL